MNVYICTYTLHKQNKTHATKYNESEMDTKIPSQKGTRINGKGDKKGEERRA